MKPQILVTVDVEEWYHSNWFDKNRLKIDHFETCTSGVDKLISLFKTLNVHATFFCLGEIAINYPELIKTIASEGHEVACHGFYHLALTDLEKKEHITQIKRAKIILEATIKKCVLGYRAPNYKINNNMYKVLSEIGFNYDSSIVPCLKIPGWYGNPKLPINPYCIKSAPKKVFWEIPIAVHPLFRIPAGGGWFLRNFGAGWIKFAAHALSKKGPVTLYVHPWEVAEYKPDSNKIPFHVFRRTGKYVQKAIASIINSLDADSLTITEFLDRN